MKVTLSVTVSPDLFAALTDAAASAGVNRSWLVGRVLGEWLAHNSLSASRHPARERGEAGGAVKSQRRVSGTNPNQRADESSLTTAGTVRRRRRRVRESVGPVGGASYSPRERA